MSNQINIGDEVTVKNIDYGYFTVRQIHPNGFGEKKCRMLELEHRVNKTSTTGFIRYYRQVDCKKVAS